MASTALYSDRIEYHFLEKSGGRLFCTVHYPAPQAGGTEKPVVLMLNPIFEERSRSHRFLFNWSRTLAALGHPVIRFDYFGTGDSEGQSEQVSIDTQLADISTLLNWAHQKFPGHKTALHGLRWGASLAALFAAGKPDELHHLVMWEPIKDGRTYLMAELRKNLASQLMVHNKVVVDRKQMVAELESGKAVNIDGYLFGSEFWSQIDRVKKGEPELALPVLRYQFLKSIPADAEDGRTIEKSGNLTSIGSVVPHFFIEIKEYYNFDSALFENTKKWIDSLD